MYNDTVSDFLTRIRNASLAKKQEVLVRYSKIVENLASILKKQGYLISIEKLDHELKIYINLEMPLSRIKRLSKPGIRRYVSYKDIPRPHSGFGLVILSTPKGVMVGPQAHKQKVGGELICEIW
jgi:small subunit ribosomal protein S8